MLQVLLAEDDRLNQIVAAGALRALGYEFQIVDTGDKAVATWTAGGFDALLMDVMMPGMDGYQAATAIRAHEAQTGAPRAPIIGLSARAMDGDREVALAAGFDEYLTKPLRQEELRAALDRCLALMP
jgi:CheY-like chemotaxis protein